MSDRWRRLQHRLLNMSPNGRAFCLRALSSRRDIDLHAMAWVEMQDAESIISQILQGKSSILIDRTDPHQEKALRLDTALSTLYREINGLREETGQYPLFIGYPFVCGKFADGTPFRGPLFLLPVTLMHRAGTSPRWELQATDAPNGYWNRVLLHALDIHHSFRADAQLASEWPETGVSVSGLHTWLHSTIKKYHLPLFMQQELFLRTIPPFRSMIRSTLESLPDGRLDIVKEGTLGLFPVADTSLFDDYEELIRQAHGSPEFLKGFPEKVVDQLPEKERFWISNVDEFQEEALLSVRAGNNILLHGPPGTGKTQVIRNAIAQAIGEGKTVLVVSQKRAALEVVHERLTADGLGDYCAMVHDAGADRNRIYDALRKQIEDLEYLRVHHDQGYLARLEKTFLDDGDRTDEQVAWFERLVHALTFTHAHGFSAHELYIERRNTRLLYVPVPAVWNKERLIWFQETLQIFWPLRKFFSAFLRFSPAIPWKQQSAADVRLWHDKLCNSIDETRSFIENAGITGDADLFTCDPNALAATREILGMEAEIIRDPLISKLWNYPDHSFAELQATTEGILNSIHDSPMLEELAHHTLPVWRTYATEAKSVSGLSWFSFSRWRKIRELKKEWNSIRFLDPNELWIQRTQQITDFLARIAEILECCGITSDVHRPVEILTSVLTRLKETARIKALAKRSGIAAGSLQAFLDVAHRRKDVTAQFGIRIQILEKMVAIPAIPTGFAELQNLLDTIQPATKAQNIDYEALREAGCVWDSLPDAGRQLIIEYPEFLEADSSTDLSESLRQSLFNAWISQAEQDHPELTTLGLPTVELRREDLRNRITRQRSTASLIVRHRMQSRLLENIRYNRQHNRVTFRELYHQVTKKRHVWPVRKLVSSLWKEELSFLRPCWLMSPEAVSSVFPMVRNLFDLVILDEASQCYAESAIPVLWRGKQFLVCGDEQQLKPSSLYRTRIEGVEQDETDEVQLAESAIDLVRPCAVSHYLRWHYRSLDEALIAFSNEHFYQDRLLTFPAVDAQKVGTPFIWHPVQGIWKDQQNLEEAISVVNRILELYQSGTPNSLGVVTFNFPQQQLIQDLLYERLRTEPTTGWLEKIRSELEAPDTRGLIIKNIENIQGDERDIILYSTAYGQDTGGVFTSRFGSLSQKGGENRLNVAITRARIRQEVFCSFHPDEILLPDNAHPGPGLFKAWLQYVLVQSRGKTVYPAPTLPDQAGSLSKVLLRKYPQLTVKGKFGYGNSRIRIPIAVPSRGLAIDGDGPDYFHAPGARAREVYRPMLLESRGWNYLRVWSRRPEHPDLAPFTG